MLVGRGLGRPDLDDLEWDALLARRREIGSSATANREPGAGLDPGIGRAGQLIERGVGSEDRATVLDTELHDARDLGLLLRHGGVRLAR